MTIKAHQEKSVHQGFLGRLRMKGKNFQTGSGAEYIDFDFTPSGWNSSRPYSALEKITAYLEEKGYIFKERSVKYAIGDKVYSYWHIFQNGQSEIQISESLPFENSLVKKSRVDRVRHYPNGKTGPYAGTITVSDVIGAMSWGMAA